MLIGKIVRSYNDGDTVIIFVVNDLSFELVNPSVLLSSIHYWGYRHQAKCSYFQKSHITTGMGEKTIKLKLL